MTTTTAIVSPYAPWQRYVLRFGIVFIAYLTIPLQADFYQTLAQSNWTYLISDLFNLLVYLPHFFGPIAQPYDWALGIVLAAILAFIWVKLEKKDDAKDALYYYLLRVVVRFRLAAILFVAGFTKFFAIFAPELSLSHLNTAYGYFEDWKHLHLSLSAAPAYLVFLGIVELVAALLLLFRKTSFLAVVIIIPFYGNVFLADIAYGGAYYLSPAYIVLLTLPVFLYDVGRLTSLIINLQSTVATRWKFDWTQFSWGRWKWLPKLLFVVLFGVLVGFRSYEVQQSASLHYPEEKGLPGIVGKYAVDSFILNGDTLAFSPNDSTRWKDVVFEKWNTISVRVNRPIVATTSVGFLKREDAQRDYEYAEVGDRLYYRYSAAADGKQLVLKNPNPHYKDDQYTFSIARPDSTQVLLVGTNAKGDSLRVSLRNANKRYLLNEIKEEGRRQLGFKL